MRTACRVGSLDELTASFPQVEVTDIMRRAAERYPFAVTPYYLSLIENPSPTDPIYRQCVPDGAELGDGGLRADELGEDSQFSPVPGLIHRYPDRVVCLATTRCPTYCRHCTRKRLVGRPADTEPDFDAHADYVRAHPAVRDVIISGGDPLTMTTERLDDIIRRFRDVPSVDIIRIHTRAPVTLPTRLDDALCEMLKRHHPVWVNTQFNHPREITRASAAACDRLLRRGIPVGNQTVLLRGVNDEPAVMEELCRALLRIRVRPYYMLQCDPVAGTEHFHTPIERGIDILRHLHRTVGGLGVPRFVVDAINGGGKVPIDPGFVAERRPGTFMIENFDGEIVSYPDPAGCSELP